MEQPTPYFVSAEQAGKSDVRPTRRSPPRKRASAESKRTLKYLTVCRDPATSRRILHRSSDRVIKTLCNVALNILMNDDIPIGKTLAKRLRALRPAIQQLSNREIPIPWKRRLLTSKGQTGRGLIAALPIIISTVLGALGSRVFEK
jgi:hypothetical protein